MIKKHVIKKLSAYCQGELEADETRRVAEHLLKCQRCRKEYEAIKFGVTLLDRLPGVPAPASLWTEIEKGLVKGRTGERPRERLPRSTFYPLSSIFHSLTARPWPLALAAMLLVAIGITAWFLTQPSKPAWEVISLTGTPKIGSDYVDTTGQLVVGEWLETDDRSRAQIKVGQIGHVEVEPNSRVRLVETRMTEHRLAMARGLMHATIWAPPRLFFVETPSAVAVDLGCAYTLEVDDDGSGLLHVTSGWVALEHGGRESIVPAGGMCITMPGMGPGTPFFPNTSEAFHDALARFDFENGGSEALKTLLAEAQIQDTITLWHLLSRVDESQRESIYDRLAALVTPPGGVTREGVLRLDKPMLDRWWDKLELTWPTEDTPAWRKAWRRAWKGMNK